MTNLDNATSFDIPCPNCGDEFAVTVGQPKFFCPHCAVTFNAIDFNATVEVVEKLGRDRGREVLN